MRCSSLVVAEHEERPAAALGLDALAQLGGRRAVGLEGRRGSAHPPVKVPQGEADATPGGHTIHPGWLGAGAAPGAPLGHDEDPAPPDRLPHRLRRAARRPGPRRRRPRVRRDPRALRGPPARVRAPAPRRRAPRRRGGRAGRVRPRAPRPARRRPRDGAQGVALHDRPQPRARRAAPPGPHDRHRAARADAVRRGAPTRASASPAPRSSTRSSPASSGCPSASAPRSSCTRWAARRTTRSPARLDVTTGGSKALVSRRARPACAHAPRRPRNASLGAAAAPRPLAARAASGRGRPARPTGTSRRSSSSSSAVIRSTSSPLQLVGARRCGRRRAAARARDHREQVAHVLDDPGAARRTASIARRSSGLGGLRRSAARRSGGRGRPRRPRAARRSRATRRRPSAGCRSPGSAATPARASTRRRPRPCPRTAPSSSSGRGCGGRTRVRAVGLARLPPRLAHAPARARCPRRRARTRGPRRRSPKLSFSAGRGDALDALERENTAPETKIVTAAMKAQKKRSLP